MFEKLKSRWGVSTTWQVIVILIVFSLAGCSILYVKTPVLDFLHIPKQTTLWIKIPLIILVYQVLLLFWGGILGHFSFFWQKEKKLARLLFGWALPRRAESTTP
jgi:hypothetical protein